MGERVTGHAQLQYLKVKVGSRPFDDPLFTKLPGMSAGRHMPSDSPRTGGEKKEKRTSRACLVCRKRKSACHLYVPLPPPSNPVHPVFLQASPGIVRSTPWRPRRRGSNVVDIGLPVPKFFQIPT
nr:hypothetical protein CFP56_36246 [Quercus suber]